MTDFLLLLIVTSLWCIGVWNAFGPDMIFGKIGELARGTNTESRGFKVNKALPSWVRKPLFDCPFCMASIHGFASCTIFHGLDWMVIPFIVCLSGLNYIVIQITE